MPTYEYACQACENTWEIEQRITEAAIQDCPKCGAPKARRLISGSRFVLKGGGWYADGYGSSKPAPAKDDGKKPDTKVETKPETKSDGAKGDGAKGDSAKGDSAKGDGAKGDSKPSTSSAAE